MSFPGAVPQTGFARGRLYQGMYRRNLEKWKDVALRTLAMNPTTAHDEHKAIAKRSGPSEADHAMRLLRSVYRASPQKRAAHGGAFLLGRLSWRLRSPDHLGMPIMHSAPALHSRRYVAMPKSNVGFLHSEMTHNRYILVFYSDSTGGSLCTRMV